jgi:hypothetical protein
MDWRSLPGGDLRRRQSAACLICRGKYSEADFWQQGAEWRDVIAVLMQK